MIRRLEAGLADLTASSLLLGAAGRTLKQISEELDFMGANMSASANKDYTTVSLRVLKKDLERAFPIFMDVVTKPTFPADEVKKEISRTLAAIRSSRGQAGQGRRTGRSRRPFTLGALTVTPRRARLSPSRN